MRYNIFNNREYISIMFNFTENLTDIEPKSTFVIKST